MSGKREKEPKKGKFITVVFLILLILILPILVVNIVILVNSYIHPDEIPNFMGYKPFIVLSGSMEPTINTGDLAISKNVDVNELKKGDIISFKVKNNIVVTHRIEEVTKEEGQLAFKTKGDNNSDPDKNLVLAKNVEGIYVRNISKVGKFAMFLQKPGGFITVAAVPIIIIIITQIYTSKANQKEIEELKRQAKQ